MPYKTVSIKIRKPTTKKKKILDHAIRRYTDAFERLLRAMKPHLHDNPGGSKMGFLKLMDREVMAQLDELHVEPFKDALKLDVSMLLATYAGRISSGQKTRYPVVCTGDTDIENILNQDDSLQQRVLDAVFEKYQKTRPAMFCRFDKNRDYSILKDRKTGSYYLKLYLYNLADAVEAPTRKEADFYYLPPFENSAFSSKKRRRYVLFPLDTGQWQEQFLQEIEQKKAVPKSAELICHKGKYFFNIRLWYEMGEEIPCKNFMGVCRGVQSDLFYTVCTPDGQTKYSGQINAFHEMGRNRLHSLANQIIEIATENQCRIVMENLSKRGDRLEQEKLKPPLSATEYNQMANFVFYKAEFRGLTKPVLVSPNSTFYKCPQCCAFKHTNRLGNNLFLCVSCGYTGTLEAVGSRNLALTLQSYQKSKIQVLYKRVNGQIQYKCKVLDLSFQCAEDIHAMHNFEQFLRTFVRHPDENLTKAQSSIIKKLNSSRNLSENIEYLEVI